jgi:integrase
MPRTFNRDGAWWIDFVDADGRRRRNKIGPNKRVAKDVLNDKLSKVARRVHLGVIDDSAISFKDFAALWLERITPQLQPRTVERWTSIIDQHLKPAFPGTLRAIAASHAESYTAARLEKGACPSTVNREVTVLKHLLRRAVEWEHLSRNPLLDTQGRPLSGLRALREPAGRTRFLSLDEIEGLLKACNTVQLRAFMVVALNTGMRRNEILSLTRKSIDWQNRIATLTETKNGTARHVHLNDAALNALRTLPPRLDSSRLFPFGPNQISMSFARIAKRAGISDVRLHDLRHTFASYQAMNGVAGRGLQVLLGHKDPRMTTRYSHLSDAYLRTAVDGVVLGSKSADAAVVG